LPEDKMENVTNSIKIIVEVAPIILAVLAVLVFIVTEPIQSTYVCNPLPVVSNSTYLCSTNSNSIYVESINYGQKLNSGTFYNSITPILLVELILIVISVFFFSLSYLFAEDIKKSFLTISVSCSIIALSMGLQYTALFISVGKQILAIFTGGIFILPWVYILHKIWHQNNFEPDLVILLLIVLVLFLCVLTTSLIWSSAFSSYLSK
jgi:hypothetical protein